MSQARRIALAVNVEYPAPHHQAVYAGILRYAREQGDWLCEINQHPYFDARRRTNEQRYDGVIARATPELRRRLKRLGIPLVNVMYGRHLEGRAGVYLEPRQTGGLAAEHLLQRGFRRFGMSYFPGHPHSVAIMKGFAQRLEDDEFEVCTYQMADGDLNDARFWVGMESKINDWLSSLQTPVGLFIDSPFLARMICQNCQAIGLHIPQEVAIICMNDFMGMHEVEPKISAIQGNFEVVGYESAKLLDRMMSGEPAPTKPTLIPPRGIAARTSTDHFAVEDELVAEVLRYISAHLSEKLLVDDIAYEMAVSPRKLKMRFKSVLNRGVSQEIRRLRLSAVKVKLAEPDASIHHIAVETGFASAATLSHIFKREVGVSPQAYRKQLLGDR